MDTPQASVFGKDSPISVTGSVALRHVFRPRHVAEAISDRGPQTGFVPPLAMPPKLILPFVPTLQVNEFSAAISQALNDQCTGFGLELRQHGVAVLELSGGWGQIPADGGEAWTTNVHMHIASLSKMPTAMAVTQAFNDRNLSFDTPISGYPPAYWQQGPDINLITFRNLMTHTSGLTSGATDYESMKAAIAAGVTNYGTRVYAKTNMRAAAILGPAPLGSWAT